jgi:hypothetical protein
MRAASAIDTVKGLKMPPCGVPADWRSDTIPHFEQVIKTRPECLDKTRPRVGPKLMLPCESFAKTSGMEADGSSQVPKPEAFSLGDFSDISISNGCDHISEYIAPKGLQARNNFAKI